MQKEKLVIVIDNLVKGGAEVLLIGILPELNKRYHITLVTLKSGCDFKEEEVICAERYNLGFSSKPSFITCIFKLRKIINKIKPAVVHAHLFYSSLAARLACPSKIPLLYSIHSELSKSVFKSNRLYAFIEKLTIRKNHSIVGVSKLVLDDYIKTIKPTEKCFLLKNYIADEFFTGGVEHRNFSTKKELKLIALGNIKVAKNYKYLVESFIGLKKLPVSLDIYGNNKHRLYPELAQIIKENELPVDFKGQANNVKELFSGYDVYVMSSIFEGFGIATVEAMSCGLPVLLSDIPVLHEVSNNNALFFDINNPKALTNLIKEIIDSKYDLNELSKNGIEIAAKYTKAAYLESLFTIYEDVLNVKN